MRLLVIAMKAIVQTGRGVEMGTDLSTPNASSRRAGRAAARAPAMGRDDYLPRQSRRVTIAIEGDEDVWVERSYMNAKGHRLPYYCSARTGRRQLFEPPTGAAAVVYECQYRSETMAVDWPDSVLQIINQRHTQQEIQAMIQTTARRPPSKKTERWAWCLKWRGLTTTKNQK